LKLKTDPGEGNDEVYSSLRQTQAAYNTVQYSKYSTTQEYSVKSYRKQNQDNKSIWQYVCCV